MSADSWFKVCLPAYPLLFTILGVWLYWGENPLAILPPSFAFWGVVVLYYLFSNLRIDSPRYPLVMMIGVTTLWVVSSLTAHKLGVLVASPAYRGWESLKHSKDFWYSYTAAAINCYAGVRHFNRLEPLVVKIGEESEGKKGA